MIQNIAFHYEDSPVVDERGYFTPQWKTIIEQMINFLTQIYAAQGLVIPPFSAVEIAKLTQSKNGTLIYNTDTDKGMINENGTFKTITTS